VIASSFVAVLLLGVALIYFLAREMRAARASQAALAEARDRAESANTEGARADLDAARNTVLLELVVAWYEVLAAQTALDLSGSHVERMQKLAESAQLRFGLGVDSGGDVARAQSYLAAARSQKISVERRLQSAEARFFELYGERPGRLNRPDAAKYAGAQAELAADPPELVAARARERAAAASLDATRAERLPRFDAQVTGAGYDLLRGDTPAYDVRGQITLRQRFSTGGAEAARVAELAARRRAASLAVGRIFAASVRESQIAAADVDALVASLAPLKDAYLDSRRARDLFAEQFRVSRGTLFDVLRAEQDLVDAAQALARTSYDLDIARFTLYARRGGLIERFGIAPAVVAESR
jgi:adhesin transport system outer membrane protein